MTDATAPGRAPDQTSPGSAKDADADTGPMLAADGTPLKRSLARAMRRQKLKALALVAPLLVFIIITFIVPIGQMLFRSVENQIVPDTLPRTVAAIESWDANGDDLPSREVYAAMARDMLVADGLKQHTRLGSRLNYETTGLSSLFRQAGRDMDEFGEAHMEAFEEIDPRWGEPATWVALFATDDWRAANEGWLAEKDAAGFRFDVEPPPFEFRDGLREALPRTTDLFADFARVMRVEEIESVAEEEPWPLVYVSLYEDLAETPDAMAAFDGENRARLEQALAVTDAIGPFDYRAAFADVEGRLA